MSESKIRDKLISNLSIFDMGLELVGKEYFVPNSEGTRGFIDILAKDNYGRYVIIELKRSNSSSRQAIHEVLKYIEGLKENKSLKDDEIVSLIVSTEWNELIIPFSSYVSKFNSEVVGFKLHIDESHNPISVDKIKPIEIQNERVFSHNHTCYFYFDKNSMNAGLKSISDSYLAKGIEDYVLVVLKYDAVSVDQDKSIVGFREYFNLSNEMVSLNFLVYTSNQLLSDVRYLKIIKSNENILEEFDEDYISSLKGLDKTEELNKIVLDQLPFAKKDYVELGYPAKFSHDILECGWEVLYIKRYGRVLNNDILTDESIINELKGLTGHDYCIYQKKFRSLEHFKNSSMEMESCLTHHYVWRKGVASAVQDACNRLDEKILNSINSYIFNPSNTLYTINLMIKSAMQSENVEQWIPRYFIDIETDDYFYKYYGCLIELDLGAGEIDLNKVIEDCYEGNESKIIKSQAHGGFDKNDCEFVMTYGLEYANYLVVLNKKENVENGFYYNGFRYCRAESPHPYAAIINFIKTRTEFCKSIYELYDRHDLGGGFFIH
ncbi:endonuclease NucS domain-containing protein [Shewanella glacialipiscicola]|uniref:endonuclease NucS domain-containing protein n=1 Tax=Shewanella glacialipiscicola TaxID=614069 RepID=UPI003D78CF8F